MEDSIKSEGKGVSEDWDVVGYFRLSKSGGVITMTLNEKAKRYIDAKKPFITNKEVGFKVLTEVSEYALILAHKIDGEKPLNTTEML